MSAYQQWDLALDDALANELAHGGRALAEGVAGHDRLSNAIRLSRSPNTCGHSSWQAARTPPASLPRQVT